MNRIVPIILWPFSLLYGIITAVRNWLYDSGLGSRYQPPVKTVSVGNLTVGGTGKTPCVEYLIRLLADSRNITVLSRGYGRHTRGYIPAGPIATASDIGDEPLQYYQKYGQKINVVVCEDRVEGFRRLYQQFPDTNLLLLDDAFQHRPIQPHLNILLNDYTRPFYHDLPFPAGRLREGRTGALRADGVIVTKCPAAISRDEMGQIKQKIEKYTHAGTPVFFARVVYGTPRTFTGQITDISPEVIAVAGIARPCSFLEHLQQISVVEKTLLYKDHHDYSKDDVAEMIKYLKKDNFVVTTEKDQVKLAPLVENTRWENRFLYIPIEMEILENVGEFEEWLIKRIVPDNE